MTNADGMNYRLKNHRMYSPSDLRELRRKGYSDDKILEFWNRDQAAGKNPVHRLVRVAISFEGVEVPDGDEGLEMVAAAGRGQAILFGGRTYVVDDATPQRLETEGVPFAYLVEHRMPNGKYRVASVPVHD